MNIKISEKVKSFLKLGCILTLLFMVLIVNYWFWVKNPAKGANSYRVISAAAEEIADMDEYAGQETMEQTVVGERDELYSFQMMFRKSEEADPTEKILVEFIDGESEEVLQSWELLAEEITEYGFQSFRLDEVPTETWEQEYVIRVTSSDLGKLAPAVTNYDAYAGGTLTADGEEQIGAVVFTLECSNGFLKPMYVLFCVLIVLGVVGLWALFMRKCKKLEYYFLVFGLVWGMIYILFFTPFSAPDEAAHIATAYADADKILLSQAEDENGNVFVREDDAELVRITELSLNTYSYYFDGLKRQVSDTAKTAYEQSGLTIPFVAHLPQALGVVFGWLIQANAVWTLYFGKITAFVFYLICCFFAMKWIPWGKMVLMIISLLPMSLELATSYSYDCTVNAFCFMFIAYTMKLIYEKEKVGWKDYLFLGILSVWMAPCKVVYIFVCALAFAIPKEKSGNAKWVLPAKAAVFGISGVILAVQRFAQIKRLVSNPAAQAVTETAAEAATEVTKFSVPMILGNPSGSLRMMVTTYIELGDLLLKETIGGLLGWLQVSVSWKVLCGFIVLLVVALLVSDEQPIHMSKKMRWFCIALCLIMTGGIVLSMWLACTPTDYPYILGVQGRYFIPFLPMLLMALKPKEIISKRNVNGGILIGLFVLELMTVLEFWRYVIS